MNAYTFQQQIDCQPIDLLGAALSFAQEICYPNLEVEKYSYQVECLAEEARHKIHSGLSLELQAERLASFLFQEKGFKGNSDQYHDPRNSYLNEVLERHLGIPISLSVIYLALAERLGLPAHGVGLPGHFIVGLQIESGDLLLDPFHEGQQLSLIDCARLVELSTGYSGRFQSEWLDPLNHSDILARMLYNLRSIYIQRDDWKLALAVVEHLQLLQPTYPGHLRDLGVICREAGLFQQAIDYFQRYLVAVPEAQDAALVRRDLRDTIAHLSSRN